MQTDGVAAPPSPVQLALEITCALIAAGKITPKATSNEDAIVEMMKLVVAAGSKMTVTATRSPF